jgi:hypothetical protein
MSPAKKRVPAPNTILPRPTDEEIASMVAEAAYYKAEHRGFTGGDPQHDWWEAEKEIEAKLAASRARGATKRSRAARSENR